MCRGRDVSGGRLLGVDAGERQVGQSEVRRQGHRLRPVRLRHPPLPAEELQAGDPRIPPADPPLPALRAGVASAVPHRPLLRGDGAILRGVWGVSEGDRQLSLQRADRRDHPAAVRDRQSLLQRAQGEVSGLVHHARQGEGGADLQGCRRERSLRAGRRQGAVQTGAGVSGVGAI